MIRFFRTIRKKLATENKFMAYSRYAIGEIVLVVIGILIALKINNWNEDRKLEIQENLYLNRLLIENKEDVNTFKTEIKNLSYGIETIKALSEALRDSTCSDSILLEKANDYFQFGSIYPSFTSSTSTFDDLSSTGNLRVLTNSDLRDRIVKHYAKHKQVEERIQTGIEWALPVDGTFTYEHSIMRFEPSSNFLFPNASKHELALSIRSNTFDYINIAASHYWLKKDAIDQLQALVKETEDIIASLESEIKQ